MPKGKVSDVKTWNFESSSIESLRQEWRTMYTETLPKNAREKAPAQKHWPVTLDHCFARIVLDAVAGDTPWMEKIKSPAYKNMTEAQLRKALDIGQSILDGKASLVELDEQSLALRGKKSKAAPTKKILEKRKTPNESTEAERNRPSSSTKKARIDLTEDDHIDLTVDDTEVQGDGRASDKPGKQNIKPEKPEDSKELEAMIDSLEKTEFQKKCLKLLLQIPEGHFSTYGAMAKALGSAPRAVGNAMRGNPLAPSVPCHRILASDRTIGGSSFNVSSIIVKTLTAPTGFGGSWGVEGKHFNEKMELLTKEGVKFDSKGRVKGPVFEDHTPV